MLKFNSFSRLFYVKLEAGEYTTGELVVLKQCKKLTLNSDGTLKKVFFIASGRKIL